MLNCSSWARGPEPKSPLWTPNPHRGVRSIVSLAQESRQKPPTSKWSFRMLSVSGIPIRIHFTFLLLLGWIALSGPEDGRLMRAGLVISIFACVLLHELGHALTARRFGIDTTDITLYPIGGVAMLDGRPRAKQELWIALAGPAVNAVIALVCLAIGFIAGGFRTVDFSMAGGNLLGALLVANITLAAFNMIPAFPMDGGRVLRAILALNMPENKATSVAGGIGQILAVGFGIFGIMAASPIFVLIALFVFFGAAQEVSMSTARSFLTGHPIQDAMQFRYRTIESGQTLEEAARMLLEGSQHDFPVMAGNEVVGILTRADIADGLANDGSDAYVAGHMRRDFKTAHPNIPLEMAIDMFSQGDQTPVLVMDDEQIVGMLTQENLSEFIMLQHARQEGRKSYGYTA